MLRELPEGWDWVRLEDITSKIETINPENYPDKEFFYLDIDSIDNSQQKITNPKKILGSEAPSRARQIVKTGDILFSTVRTYLKNIAFVEEQYDNQIASTGFCVIRPKKEVDGKFIFNYVQTQDFLKKLELLQRGANYPAVRESDILSQKIPLPPLPIQRQIIAVLEKAEAVKWQRREADALTGALLQSVFYEMFGDPVRNERGWPINTLRELSYKITDGKHGDCTDLENSGYFFISAKDIVNGKIVYSNSRQITKEDYLETNKRLNFEIGDIILTNSGSFASIAKTAIAEDIEKTPRTTFQKSVAIIKSNKKIVDSTFLISVLKLNKSELYRLASGSSQKNLLIKDISNFKIPIPPLTLQQQFARVVESVERIREQQVASGRQIEGLCEGLMVRAFAGELVG